MATIQIQTSQLLDAALQMPNAEFERFVTRLFALKARQRGATLSEQEADLLIRINRGLPAQMQARLNALIDKRRASTISSKELRELNRLVADVEKFDVQRMEHLTQLAAVRNVPLKKLIKQLGIEPAPHA